MRTKGTFNFASNFEVITKAPLDARLVVGTKSDLINPVAWRDINNNVWIYKGIVVSVVSDPSPSNNGLYFLIDDANYTDYNYWAKLNSTIDTDASGTTWATWQLNNDSNGVILKDVSGNLEVVTFDQNTFANIKAGSVSFSSLKIDNLTGTLYAQDGSVYVMTDSSGYGVSLLAYKGWILGNTGLSTIPIQHNLNTLNQVVTVWDKTSNEITYPDVIRDMSTNIVKFSNPLSSGQDYDIVIVGFKTHI